jgi:hypothetical protein
VGCQAHGMKKQVVRPVRNSLQVREFVGKEEAGCQACEKLSPGERGCWGSDFSWREPNNNYSALRIHVWPVVEALEGKWGSRRTVEQRRGTLPGVGQACGE